MNIDTLTLSRTIARPTDKPMEPDMQMREKMGAFDDKTCRKMGGLPEVQALRTC
jgi:hypothetical protein